MNDEDLRNKIFEYLDIENGSNLYKFVIDIKNGIKKEQLFLLYGFGSNGKTTLIKYIAKYLVTKNISYIQIINLSSLKYLKDEYKNKLIYVNSNGIDFNILNTLLNRDNKWNFISETNDIRIYNSLLFFPIHFKKSFNNLIKALKNDNFDIYNFNVYSSTSTDKDILIIRFNINFIHSFSFKLNLKEFNEFKSFIYKIKEQKNIIFKTNNITLIYTFENFNIIIDNENFSNRLYFKNTYFFKKGIENFINLL